MHMARTTLNLDEKLIKDAMKATGLKTKTEVLHAGLNRLLLEEAIKFFVSIGGTMPNAEAPTRRRRQPITKPIENIKPAGRVAR
jgi:Arc/MetJ family transcription regulator